MSSLKAITLLVASASLVSGLTYTTTSTVNPDPCSLHFPPGATLSVPLSCWPQLTTITTTVATSLPPVPTTTPTPTPTGVYTTTVTLNPDPCSLHFPPGATLSVPLSCWPQVTTVTKTLGTPVPTSGVHTTTITINPDPCSLHFPPGATLSAPLSCWPQVTTKTYTDGPAPTTF